MSADIIDFNPGINYLIDFGSHNSRVIMNSAHVVANVPRYVKLKGGWLHSALYRQAVCVIKMYEGTQDQYQWVKHPSKTGKVTQEDMPQVIWQLMAATDWREVNAK